MRLKNLTGASGEYRCVDVHSATWKGTAPWAATKLHVIPLAVATLRSRNNMPI